MLLITKDTVVTLNYDLTDSDGDSIETNATLAYLHGSYDGIFPKVEAELT
ncbi:MAG: peptidylprolyl isomerase, partial [Anabaena sp. MDT14b]